MQFFLGIIFIAAGFLLVWKSEWLVSNFGQVDWAEQHLGTEGGTRIFWKLLGIGIMFLAMLYMFGFFEGILHAIFSPLFRG